MLYRRKFSLASKTMLVCAVVVSGCISLKAIAAESQKLAVVNVSKVFEKYAKVADVQKRIDAVHNARKIELEARGKELQNQNKNLTELYARAGNSEEVFDSVQRLRKFQFVYERDVAQLNEQIQKDYTREMREVLSDIRQAIKAQADETGFDMVLRSPDSDNPEVIAASTKMKDPADVENQTYLQTQDPQTVGEVLERFNRNPVLFGADAVDITPEVLKRLNVAHMKHSMAGSGLK